MDNQVFKIFEGKGDIYLVGGEVRDRIMGYEDVDDRDLDFTTNLLPDEIEKILHEAGYKTYDVGKAFGTISFMLLDNKVEITTFRKNEKYQRDNRRPVVEWGTKVEDDLIRRDFTFNAMALDKNGEVVDLFNGREHLKSGIIETTMDPEEIFNDDPLRILRAVRFRSRYGFKYSERVKNALSNQAYRLLWLPKERILDELNKILVGDHVKEAIVDMMDLKLWNYIIPELLSLRNVRQEGKFHSKDVWLHTVDVVNNITPDVTLEWAALLHDIGKVATFSIEDDCIHFYRHEEVSALMARSILERLGLSRKMIEDVIYLVRNHMKGNLYTKEWSDSAVRRFIVENGDYVERLLELSRSDITSHRAERVQFHLENLNDFKRRIEELRNYKELKCPIGGSDIMERFKLEPGREIGRLKDIIMEALTNGELNLGEDKEVYLKYLEGK